MNNAIGLNNFSFLFDYLQAMKAFIDAHYQMMDINADGLVSIEEYRYNCITRIALDDIKQVDDSYNQLVSVSIDT